jgi:hypothetical protein
VYTLPIFLLRATCTVHITFLDLVIVTIWWRVQIIEPSRYTVVFGILSPFLDPNFLSSAYTLCVLPLMWETKFHTHTVQQKKVSLANCNSQFFFRSAFSKY